jgi:hypothetical protein
MEHEEVNNDITYNGNLPPEMFDTAILDIALKAESLGIEKKSFSRLNIERYVANLKLLSEDGLILSTISEQTEEMCLRALYQNPESFRYVVDQSEKLCEFALSKDPELIRYFHTQTEDQVKHVLSISYLNIFHIKEPTDEQYKFAINEYINGNVESGKSPVYYFINAKLGGKFLSKDVIKFATDTFHDKYHTCDNFPYLTSQNDSYYDHRHVDPFHYECFKSEKGVEYALSKDVRFLYTMNSKNVSQSKFEKILTRNDLKLDLLYRNFEEHLTDHIILHCIQNDKVDHFKIFTRIDKLSHNVLKNLVDVFESKIGNEYFCKNFGCGSILTSLSLDAKLLYRFSKLVDESPLDLTRDLMKAFERLELDGELDIRKMFPDGVAANYIGPWIIKHSDLLIKSLKRGDRAMRKENYRKIESGKLKHLLFRIGIKLRLL